MAEFYFSKEQLLEKAAGLKRDGYRPGYDGMGAQSAELWFMINAERLLEQLAAGKYEAAPVSGFHVAKKSGGFRTLVHVTAVDTVIQKCLLDYVSNTYDAAFSAFSYAYRPGRGVAGALQQYCAYGTAHRWAAKIDPTDCFGNIDFSLLEPALAAFLKDDRLCGLLMAFARAPLTDDGELVHREKGIPQGVPVGPFLCKVYLHSLDLFLEKSRIPFVRYADDVVLFGNDYDALSQQMQTVLRFLRKKLRLQPNPRKCTLDAPMKLSYLGHRFLAGKNGILTLEVAESVPTTDQVWQVSDGSTVNVLSDGILRQKDFSLLLESDGGNANIPIKAIDCINVFSNVIFDSGFFEAAAEHGVIVNVFDRYDHLVGRYYPNKPMCAPTLTLKQLEACCSSEQRIALAKKFVLAAVHNLRLNIRYYRRHHDSLIFNRKLAEIDEAEKKIKAAEAYRTLLRLEAQVRGAYYDCFDTFLENSGYRFEKRSKRPPRNEVNALINFGNTVLYSHIATEIYKTALDVRVGFLHATNARLESLNLDVAEIFRPLVVDRVVFSLLNRKQLDQARHFSRFENGAVYLNAEGKRIFLQEFYDKMFSTVKVDDVSKSYHNLIREEVRKLLRLFRVGEPYKPFKQVR